MTITLQIDNCDALPDGGPLAYTSNNHGFDFGRESHLDWTLPDDSRYISGRHCEIRFEQGQYFLYDISRNGTFVNGSQDRVKSPYPLQNGDKISVGHYLILVTIQGGAAQPHEDDAHGASQQQHASASDDIWSVGGDSPPPIARRDLMPPKKQGQREADFSQQYIDIPQMQVDQNFQAATGAANPFEDPSISSQVPIAVPPIPAIQPEPPHQHSPVAAPVPQSPAAHPVAAPLPTAAQPPKSFPPQAGGVQQNPFQAGAANAPYAPPAPPVHAAPIPAPQAAPTPVLQPVPQPPQQPSPLQQQPAQAAGGGDLLQHIALGAGVPVSAFGNGNPADMAQEIGAVLRVAVEQMAQLLKARAAAKTMSKSSNRTMISSMDNNPLKFVPTTDEMFDVMFARRKAGYLGAKESFDHGFEDLKIHEFSTYSAMQKALGRLLEDFSPDSIEDKLPSSAFTSKSSKAWETYVARWEAMSEPHENGVLDVFLKYFADAYDEASKSKKIK